MEKLFELANKIVELIAKHLENKACTDQVPVSEKIQQLKTDVGILESVVDRVDERNPKNLDEGVKKWKKQAVDDIVSARKLLQKLDQTTQSGKRHIYSNADVQQLNNLIRTVENLSKHNVTVMDLTKNRDTEEENCYCFGWCGWCK